MYAIFSEEYDRRWKGLGSLLFMERCALGYRIMGTDYVCDLMVLNDWCIECVWYTFKEGVYHRISFEEVFDGVDEGIRDEMIFHLDLFK